MQKRKVILNLGKNSRSSWFLYPLGDTHYGNYGCDERALKRTIKEIETTTNAYWLGMGDYFDAIDWRDPRFDASSKNKDERIRENKYWIQREIRKGVKPYEPIFGKCLGLLEGNHERNIALRFSYSMVGDFASRINQYQPTIDEDLENNDLYLGYETLIHIGVTGNDCRQGKERYNIKIYAHHGFGGGKKPGSHANNLLDLATSVDADIYLLGHNHWLLTFAKPRLGLSRNGDRYIRKTLHFVNTGTYLKSKMLGHDGYEVVKGYSPTIIGSPIIKINIKQSKEKKRQSDSINIETSIKQA